MSQRPPPVCLSFGVLDASGATGALADLKSFTALGCYGSIVATGIVGTDLSRSGLLDALPRQHLSRQLVSVPADLPLSALKLGLMPGCDVVHQVSAWLSERPQLPVVVDASFATGRGLPLVRPEVVRTVAEELLPRATILTMNRYEAAVLLSRREEILQPDDMEDAGRAIHGRWGCPVLITGGGLADGGLDVFCGVDGTRHIAGGSGSRLRIIGAGGMLSAAIAAQLARGEDLREAIALAKAFTVERIRAAVSRPVIHEPVILWHALPVDEPWAMGT
jgi:hydroxymethylpyrimidine/phosphomethylpyrimidine kinase